MLQNISIRFLVVKNTHVIYVVGFIIMARVEHSTSHLSVIKEIQRLCNIYDVKISRYMVKY